MNSELNKEIELLRKKFSSLIKKRHELEVVMGTGEANEEISAAFQEWASIRTSKVVNRSIGTLLKKYRLTPEDLWDEGLFSLIFDGQFQIGNYFLGDNFLVFVDVEKNYKPQVYVQIFENTSINDLRRGWTKIIEKIRDQAIGKKRYYPLEGLKDMQQLQKIDNDYPRATDYEKQEKLFGEASGENWGAIEKNRKKKLKNLRYQARKKSEPKS